MKSPFTRILGWGWNVRKKKIRPKFGGLLCISYFCFKVHSVVGLFSDKSRTYIDLYGKKIKQGEYSKRSI